MMLYLLGMLFFVFFISSSLYISYYSFIGRQIFTPINANFWIFVVLFLNPGYLRGLSHQLSPIFFIILGFLLPAIIIFFIYFSMVRNRKDDYNFFNSFSLTNDSKAIAEHALENLGISYESLKDATRLSEYKNTSLLYANKNSISFRQVQDKVLQEKITQEIKQIMDTYTKPSKIFGFISLLFSIVFMFFGVLHILQ